MTSTKVRLRRLGALLVAVAMATMGLMVPATAAQAVSGGGCGAKKEWRTGQYTYVRITACISMSGRNLYPDMYVEGNNEPNCEIRETMVLNGVDSNSHVYPCTTAHRGPWGYRVLPPSGYAYTRVWMVFHGSTAIIAYSPNQYFP